MLRKVHLKQKINIKPKPEKTRKTALRHALRGHGLHQKQSLNSFFLFVFNEYSLRYDLLTYC